jgi:hypothetical protein
MQSTISPQQLSLFTTPLINFIPQLPRNGTRIL